MKYCVLQHIKETGDGGVHYFVAGASSPEDDHPEHLDGLVTSTRYFWTNHVQKELGAFLYCDVRKDSMAVSFIRSDEANLYTSKILPRSHPANQNPQKGGGIAPIPVLKHHPFNPMPRKFFQPASSNARRSAYRRQQHFVQQHQHRRPGRSQRQAVYNRPL